MAQFTLLLADNDPDELETARRFFEKARFITAATALWLGPKPTGPPPPPKRPAGQEPNHEEKEGAGR